MRSNAHAATAQPIDRGDRRFSASLRILVALLACAAAFLGIGAPAASAAPEAKLGWSYQQDLSGRISNTLFELSRSPIAVDSHGNVFFADQSTGRTDAYAPDGTYLGEYSFTGEARNLAIDPTDDAMYVDNVFGGPIIQRFVSDGKAVPTYTVDAAFSVPVGADIAVDPTTHDLLVTDPGAEAVLRYDSSGALLATIATPSINPTWIAAASDGSFYVAPDGGSDITHIGGSGTVLGTITGVGPLAGLDFNAANGLLVALVGDTLKTYTPAGVLLSEVPGAAATTGIGTRGSSLYAVANETPQVYALATFPGVEAPVISDPQARGAHVEAEVDPGAGPPEGSVAQFEYSADGGKTWASTPDQPLAGPETIEADLTGLSLNTAYLVRVKASNALASTTSAAVPFATVQIAPEVEVGRASDLTPTSAFLNATINAAGLQTTYHFEYGLTTAYGLRIPVAEEAVAGDARVKRAFQREVRELTPGTTYHFRVVAQNSQGVSVSADGTFTTPVLGGLLARAYEQVTPVDKGGVPVDPAIGFMASPDGNAISYLTRNGTDSSPMNARAISLRGASDWGDWTFTDPPITVHKQIMAQPTIAVSDDLEHAFVASNRKLSDDATEGWSNLYVRDLETGKYTLVAKSENPAVLERFSTLQAGSHFLAGAPDFSWLVFRSFFSLVPGVPDFALYRWSAEDGLQVVSTVPGAGEPVPVNLASPKGPRANYVSPDGSRIYFSTLATEPGVYLSEDGQVKAISASQIPGDPATPHAGVALGGSKDGRYAFFALYEGKLTADAPGEEGDMYRFDAEDGSLEFLGTQFFLSDPESMRDHVFGMSDDGGTIYFQPRQDINGLKVWRDGTVSSIPTSITPQAGEAQVSPNGDSFAFKALPDPLTAGTEGSKEEHPVYVYEIDSGEVSCVSCTPTGDPKGAYLINSPERFSSNYVPQPVSNNGQVFVTTKARLVAADVNSARDVYEYQDGQLRLISPGEGPFSAEFADATPDGSTVFFTTNQKLVGRDDDGATDIYAARAGGGFAAQSPPAPRSCGGADCRPPSAAAPPGALGGSETFAGTGNVKPAKPKRCAKGKRAVKTDGKVRCVKKAVKKKVNRSKSNRRGSR